MKKRLTVSSRRDTGGATMTYQAPRDRHETAALWVFLVGASLLSACLALSLWQHFVMGCP